jgi:hypothetical protein
VMSHLRVVLLMHRLELLIFVALTAIWMVAAALVVAVSHATTSASPQCFGHLPTGSACGAVVDAFIPIERMSQLLASIVPVFGLAAGTLVGVGIVARELEQGTAQISWSLATSRIRWLRWRSTPALLAVVALVAILALMAEFLVRTRLGLADPGYIAANERGPIVVARSVLAFGSGLVVGALIGRQLPALIAAVVLAIALSFGVDLALDAWRAAEARPVTFEAIVGDEDLMGGMTVDQIALLPDGTYTRERDQAHLPSDYQDGALILPASTFVSWGTREVAAVLAVALATGAAAAVVVSVRRPR